MGAFFMSAKLKQAFYRQDVLTLAPALLGKLLCVKMTNGSLQKYAITEVEAYRGEEDLACHAAKGKTERTRIMYAGGGFVYVYLIYGMHWMLNMVSGEEGVPQAVLIRGVEGVNGPGRVGKRMQIDRSFYGEALWHSQRIWIEDAPPVVAYQTSPRINIAYAGAPWVHKQWRFFI